MRKLITLFLSIILILSLGMFGCGKTPPDDGGGTTPIPPVEEEKPAPKKPIKVYLIAGQSNALGISFNIDVQGGIAENKDVLIYSGGEGAEPVNGNVEQHNRWDYVKGGYGLTKNHFGIEVGMSEVFSGVMPADEDGDKAENVAIIKYAWGGTGIHARWLSPTSFDEGYVAMANDGYPFDGSYVRYKNRIVGDLYRNFFVTYYAAMSELNAMGYEPKVMSMAWMQGDDDAQYKKPIENYPATLKNLIGDIRGELKIPALPVVIGEVSNMVSPFGNRLRAIQRQTAAEMDNVSFFSTMDLEMGLLDVWHYYGPSMITLGKRFASEMLSFETALPDVTAQTVNVRTSTGNAPKLPEFVEAVGEKGEKILLKAAWNEVSADLYAQKGSFTANGTSKHNGKAIAITAAVTVDSEPVVDGRLDDSAYSSSKVYTFTSGNTMKVYGGSTGIYFAYRAADTDIENIFSNNAMFDWDLVNNDGIEIYVDTSANKMGFSSGTHAFWLNAANLLRIYHWKDDGSLENENKYMTLPYIRSGIQRRVIIDGTPNYREDIDVGYTMELFVPYTLLGVSANDTSNVSVLFSENRKTGDTKKWECILDGFSQSDISRYIPLSETKK